MRFFSLLILTLIGLAVAAPSFGMQITDYPSFLNIRPSMPLTAIVSVVFNALLMAGGLAGLVMIVLGGVKYLTSAGLPAETKDAKNQIFAAILGLIILFSSWLVLNSINPEITTIREPSMSPVPVITPPDAPSGPTDPSPAAFFYIPLGEIIDDVIEQEQDSLPKMRDFADSAMECHHSQCDGGECEYWVSVPCPEEEGEEGEEGDDDSTDDGTEDTGDDSGGGFDWGDFFWMLKIPTVQAEGDCGYWATCSAPCNTGDPCPPDRSSVVSEVLAAADKMEEEIAQLRRAKTKIGECVLKEETILLSCEEAKGIYEPEEGEAPPSQWDEIYDCEQGYDFYCLYGTEEEGWLDKIVLPFETIKGSIAKTRELENIVYGCNCSQCMFCCECCAACGGTPCPSQTYSLLSEAVSAVGELEARLNRLESTISEITGLSMADEVSALTCSEAYSWLKSIKESGCPGVRVFPCCPIDEAMQETIRTCQGTDFFFCTAP